MPDNPAFLSERLDVEGKKIFDIFAALSDEEWNMEVYSEGTVWTVRNVLAHFVTAERGFLRLFENIRTGGGGASEDFSIDRYNASQQTKTQNLTSSELLEQFKSLRTEMISWVSRVSDKELELVGRHPFLGLTTLAEMVKMVYRHNQIHYRDIRKILHK